MSWEEADIDCEIDLAMAWHGACMPARVVISIRLRWCSLSLFGPFAGFVKGGGTSRGDTSVSDEIQPCGRQIGMIQAGRPSKLELLNYLKTSDRGMQQVMQGPPRVIHWPQDRIDIRDGP